MCRSVAQLADLVAVHDPDFVDVARLWRGSVEIDLTKVVAELVADQHVPAQAGARYKKKGHDKRAVWERTWALQRIEDAGEPLPDGLERIPVPPKYTQADFAKPSFYKLRGKLDVPKERFTSIVGAETDVDASMVLAWAGFDHAQLSQAVGTLIHRRLNEDGWDAQRCWPLVVALIEQLEWLDQWYSEIDPRWGDSPANIYRGIATQHATAAGHHPDDATAWRPPAKTRPKKKTKKTASPDQGPSDAASPTAQGPTS
jgi:hypothetical protein